MRRTVLLTICCLTTALLVHGQSEDFGAWKSVFNGNDMTGWEDVYGKNKGKVPAQWSVTNGAMTNSNGHVEDICTSEVFDNYELQVEYKVPPGGNSGIYLRGSIEVQILDNKNTAKKDLRPGHAGGIYGGLAPMENPQKKAGEWNLFTIRHIGYRITVWHNGVLVQDNVYRAENTPGCHGDFKGTPTKGPVMFQGNHSKVWYRNIRIRPLCSGDGWRPIWTGMPGDKDIATVFTTPRDAKKETNLVKNSWDIIDNAITNSGWGKKGKDMWTQEHFGNFLVHYEYKSDPDHEGGNSGFYLRDQWEIQILRSSATNDAHSDGALYSIFPPEKVARHGPTNWNHMDVKVEGVKIWVWQNGTLIHDGKICKWRTDSGKRTVTDKFSAAPFKFQGDHGKVWFANLYIKPLPPSK